MPAQNYTPKPGGANHAYSRPIDIILPRLEGHGLRQTGPDKYVFRCPAHDDRTASVALKELDDGRIVIHDFAGCPTEAILASIGLTFRDLFPPRLDFDPDKPRPKPPRFSAHELIRTAAFEARVVAIGAADLLAGKPLSDSDRERLALAVETLDAIYREVSHGHS
jgi:hypothetical protein